MSDYSRRTADELIAELGEKLGGLKFCNMTGQQAQDLLRGDSSQLETVITRVDNERGALGLSQLLGRLASCAESRRSAVRAALGVNARQLVAKQQLANA